MIRFCHPATDLAGVAILGLAIIVLGVRSAAGWCIATGVIIMAIGVVLVGGSVLAPLLLGGRRFG